LTGPFQETPFEASEDDQPAIGLSDEATSSFQLPPFPENAEQPPLGAADECQQPVHSEVVTETEIEIDNGTLSATPTEILNLPSMRGGNQGKKQRQESHRQDNWSTISPKQRKKWGRWRSSDN